VTAAPAPLEPTPSTAAAATNQPSTAAAAINQPSTTTSTTQDAGKVDPQ
jgi:hypothetical protein